MGMNNKCRVQGVDYGITGGVCTYGLNVLSTTQPPNESFSSALQAKHSTAVTLSYPVTHTMQ